MPRPASDAAAAALAPSTARALLQSNAREAADLVGELSMLIEGSGGDRSIMAAARMVTRRLSDRIGQVATLERLADVGACRPDAWSPIEVVEELEHEAVALAGDRIDVRVVAPHLVPQYWFFDRELVTMTLAEAMHSALAHAAQTVSLGFELQDGYFGFSVVDDAGSFPDILLTDSIAPLERGELNGNALGIYFARVVASLHSNQCRRGWVELTNRAGGAGTRFTLWLP